MVFQNQKLNAHIFLYLSFKGSKTWMKEKLMAKFRWSLVTHDGTHFPLPTLVIFRLLNFYQGDVCQLIKGYHLWKGRISWPPQPETGQTDKGQEKEEEEDTWTEMLGEGSDPQGREGQTSVRSSLNTAPGPGTDLFLFGNCDDLTSQDGSCQLLMLVSLEWRPSIACNACHIPGWMIIWKEHCFLFLIHFWRGFLDWEKFGF